MIRQGSMKCVQPAELNESTRLSEQVGKAFERFASLNLIYRDQAICRWLGYMEARCERLSLSVQGTPSVREAIDKLNEIISRFEQGQSGKEVARQDAKTPSGVGQ